MRLIIGDTETAGLGRPTPPATGVAQVAWMEIAQNEEGKYVMVEERCELVNPGIPIEAGASEIHGIYDHMVQDKPGLFEVFDLKGPIFFIAHNRAFDLPRLAEGMENVAGSLCTLMAARRYCKGAPNNKLTTLVEHYGLQKHQAHDALGDVRMTLGLLNWLLAETGLGLMELAKAVNTPKVPTEMPFGKHKGKSFRDLPSDYILFVLGFEDLDEGLRTALNMQRRLRGNDL